MASVSHTHVPERRHHKRGNVLEFRLILSAAFVVFFSFGLIERALHLVGFKHGAGAVEHGGSTLSRAYEAANRCATYAFMG
jgi:hypothetical protein